MKTVQERIETVKALKKQVEEHCMCLNLEETDTHFIIYFPEGFYVGGAQCSKHIGKEKALSKLLKHIEEYWKQSFITGG